MPFSVYESLQDQVHQIKNILELNEELRGKFVSGAVATKSTIDESYWRRYDYCAAVLRLYASFECFIIDSIQKWLDWVVTHDTSTLFSSEKTIDRYQYGVGEILRRRSEARFSKVNIVALVDGLAALQNQKNSALGTDAIFASAPNLRLNEVVAVLDAVELPGGTAWYNAYPPLKEYCDAVSTTPESFLKDLVNRRNEAAHGNKLPEDFWSVALIKDAAEFVLLFAAATSEFMVSGMFDVVGKSEGNKFSKPEKIGIVSETFPRHNAFVIKANNIGFWVGMELLITTKTRCYIDKVKSIQINGNFVNAWLPLESEEVGICISRVPPRSASIFSMENVSWL